MYGLVSHHCRYSRWNTFLDLYTDDISAQRRRREPKLAFTHWVLLVCSDLSFLHLQLSSQPSQCVLLPISSLCVLSDVALRNIVLLSLHLKVKRESKEESCEAETTPQINRGR